MADSLLEKIRSELFREVKLQNLRSNLKQQIQRLSLTILSSSKFARPLCESPVYPNEVAILVAFTGARRGIGTGSRHRHI